MTRLFPLLLTNGCVLPQYNLGAQTRSTPNNQWHDEDRLELHPHDARERCMAHGDWLGITSRAGQSVLRAEVSERRHPGLVDTSFHFPESDANVITTDRSDWATNCPEYKVAAAQVAKVMAPSDWQRGHADFNRQQLDKLVGALAAVSAPKRLAVDIARNLGVAAVITHALTWRRERAETPAARLGAKVASDGSVGARRMERRPEQPSN